MGVARIEFDVGDLDRASRLFADLLGGEARVSAVGRVVEREGGAAIHCRRTDVQGAALHRLVIAVPDVVAAAVRLEAAGIAAATGPGGLSVPGEVLGVELVLTEEPTDVAPQAAAGPHGAAGTTAFDHVCLAVRSLAECVHLLREVLGGTVVFGGRNRTLGTLSSQVMFGSGTKVELLQPARPDAAIAVFLERHGPGLHHLTWHTGDVPAAAAAAEALGFAVVGTDVASRSHWHETYVRPSSALGLLVQISWTDRHHVDALDDATVAAILAGRIDSWDYTMVPREPGREGPRR